MPDLSPSLDLLRRLGLNVPNAGPTPSNEQIQINDMLAHASQSNDSFWKQSARTGIGALAGFTKGLVGTDPSEQTKQRILNGTANPDEKAEWYTNGASQATQAAIPFLKTNPLELLNNASGESMASLEALSRGAGMKSRGEQFVVYKGGTKRVLLGPDAVDYQVRPGEKYGVEGPNGFRLLDKH